MKIVKIEEQKRRKNRYNLYNEDGYFMGIDAYIVKKYNIEEGKEYNEEQLTEWIETAQLEKAKDYVVTYLMGNTEQKIRQRLAQKEYTATVIENVIVFMDKYGYLDDKRIGKDVMRDAVSRQLEGRNKIKQKLFQKGVKQADIEETLAQLSEEEEEHAAHEALLKKKDLYKTKAKSPYEWKAKCYQFLLRKGFPYTIATNVIEREEWTFS